MTRIVHEATENLKRAMHEIFAASIIEEACAEAGHTWRQRSLCPTMTIWAMVLQCVHGNTACRHVVQLLPGVIVSDAAYCQARSRLPRAVVERVAGAITASLLEPISDAMKRWHGHRVFFIDGSSCSMPDTPSLQRAFRQPTGQKPGCGFPKANIVGLFHRSGLLVNLLVNPLYVHEASVASQLFKHLRAGDILVGDRGFASYPLMALLHQQGAHFVMRDHHRRKVDFRRGRRVGINDQIIDRTRPQRRPSWMSHDEFASLPLSMSLRVIRYRVEQRGYRSQVVCVVTSLTDDARYSRSDIAALYGERWEAETCFRYLKTTLRMDVLRTRTEDRVLKELLAYRMAYNCIRALMVQAGVQQHVDPRRISLIDVVRAMRAGWIDGDVLPLFKVNPDRPGRVQPRAVKRRPKEYALLTRPRQEMAKAMRRWKL